METDHEDNNNAIQNRQSSVHIFENKPSPPQRDAAATHPQQLGRRQSRVEVVRLEEDPGQTSIGHGSISDVHLHTYGKNGSEVMPRTRVRTA